MTNELRQPHAVMDLVSRRLKAIKIERLLNLNARPGPIRMLEIGTGSGGISHYFATHPELEIEVHAIDVVDNRLARNAFFFELVSGTSLPFPDQAFDVVLSNHVVEHVGNHGQQLEHLREIWRVMRRDGIGYLAVPNRWMLVEPHCKLAFLSWLPRAWRSSYLRMRRDVTFYDCEPLNLAQALRLFASSELHIENIAVAALRETLTLEYARDAWLRRLFEVVPDQFIEAFQPLIPTLIFRLRRSPQNLTSAIPSDPQPSERIVPPRPKETHS
jgi:SAM-dependent methyltransferase